MESYLLWLVIGLFAGLLARRIRPGGRFGVAGDLVGDMIGGEVGGLLVVQVGRDTSLLPWGTFVAAFLGALGVIALLRLASGPDSTA
jgi:uncharacterized membrane protein YeaQ/YmgE (transglycosylase-associated protein family)